MLNYYMLFLLKRKNKLPILLVNNKSIHYSFQLLYCMSCKDFLILSETRLETPRTCLEYCPLFLKEASPPIKQATGLTRESC